MGICTENRFFFISFFYKNEPQYLKKLNTNIFSDQLFHLVVEQFVVNNFFGAFESYPQGLEDG